MIRLFPIIFFLFGCSGPADVDWAEELVVQTKVRENLEAAISACADFSRDLIGEEYNLNYQSNQLGLDAEDPAWFELAEIYEEFYEQACSHVNIEELSALFADEYRKRFSTDELQQVVQFHQSEVGSKFVAANLEVNVLMNQIVNEKMAQGSVEAQAVFESNLREFWLRQDISPKDDPNESLL